MLDLPEARFQAPELLANLLQLRVEKPLAGTFDVADRLYQPLSFA